MGSQFDRDNVNYFLHYVIIIGILLQFDKNKLL